MKRKTATWGGIMAFLALIAGGWWIWNPVLEPAPIESIPSTGKFDWIFAPCQTTECCQRHYHKLYNQAERLAATATVVYIGGETVIGWPDGQLEDYKTVLELAFNKCMERQEPTP